MKRFLLLLLIVLIALPTTVLAQDDEWEEFVSEDEMISISYPAGMFAGQADDMPYPHVIVTSSEELFNKAMEESMEEEAPLESGDQVAFVLVFPMEFIQMVMPPEMAAEEGEEMDWAAFGMAMTEMMMEGEEGVEFGEPELVEYEKEGEDEPFVLAVIGYSDGEEEGAYVAFEVGEGLVGVATAATVVGEFEDFKENALDIIASFSYEGTSEDAMNMMMGGGGGAEAEAETESQ